MSYKEWDGRVILEMSRDDYETLITRLGPATGRDEKEMMNRINYGNPHYVPYQLLDDPA